MMKSLRPLQIALTVVIALVWLINGLFCKVLNFVPRHELIVSRILGHEYAPALTRAIGVAEILMFFWIISGIRSRYCAVFQMIVVAAMNIIEFALVPDLLLFGKLNIVFASFFIAIVYIREFIMKDVKAKYAVSE